MIDPERRDHLALLQWFAAVDVSIGWQRNG